MTIYTSKARRGVAPVCTMTRADSGDANRQRTLLPDVDGQLKLKKGDEDRAFKQDALS